MKPVTEQVRIYVQRQMGPTDEGGNQDAATSRTGQVSAEQWRSRMSRQVNDSMEKNQQQQATPQQQSLWTEREKAIYTNDESSTTDSLVTSYFNKKQQQQQTKQ